MPFADIKARDVEQLLHSYTIAEKHGKAAITFRWLKTLWKWAWRGDLVQQNEMQRVRFEQVTGERERVYTDAEIKAIWKAADRLDPMESGYIKLLILLAPRKTALALCRHPDLHLSDDIPIWTTPYELTKVKKSAKGKKKRTYVTPLPPLAQRILKGVPKRHDTLVFPGLRIRHSIADRATVYSHAIRRQLIKSGAPKDFTFHAMRHTLATWFEEQKYSEWERGLVLNHSGSGSVTARYSHGRIGPLEIKLEMLTAWADHVEKLIQPKGARVLR
jgi:integrase